jgi:hypothetical protein
LAKRRLPFVPPRHRKTRPCLQSSRLLPSS